MITAATDGARTQSQTTRSLRSSETTWMGLKMDKIALAMVIALTLLCGTGVGSAQDRDPRSPAAAQKEGMRGGDGPHKGDGDRDHRHHRTVIVVGVPIFVGPYGQYGPYYAAPSAEAYRTLEGFYYYCYEPAGYYPAVPDCPSGWRLVP